MRLWDPQRQRPPAHVPLILWLGITPRFDDEWGPLYGEEMGGRFQQGWPTSSLISRDHGGPIGERWSLKAAETHIHIYVGPNPNDFSLGF